MDSVGDEAVVATNDDASICKYQAVLEGYYKDPFLDMFLSSKAKSSALRKAPEINRGYYVRSASIAYLVEQFITCYPDAQIINLGAGYDSLFWRLKSHNFLQDDGQSHHHKYVEIDMNVVVTHKIMAIKKHPKLAGKLNNLTYNLLYKTLALHSDEYHLISYDLRQVDKESLTQILQDDCKLDFSKPTLCLTECVLVYMTKHDSSNLIQWLTKTFPNLTMINYEQCNMEDRFGDIMLKNMNARHCDLMGVECCKSLTTQVERFNSQGLTFSKGWTLLDIYKQYLLPAEIDRIEKIEFLDEKELLDQLLEHYCIVIGSHKPIDWALDEEYWLAKTL